MKVIAVEQDRTRELVDRAQAGEREAFDELVSSLRPRLADSIRSWSRFQLGEKLDIDEVLQETFVRAYRSIGTFSWTGDDSFFRWLCAVAKSSLAQLAYENRRHQARRAPPEVADAIPDESARQSRLLRRGERFERLEDAVLKLKPEHREVLLLARIEGLSIKEIAARIDRSPNTVKYFLSLAIKELRTSFGDTESLRLPDRSLDPEDLLDAGEDHVG